MANKEELYVGKFTICTIPQSYTTLGPDENGLPQVPILLGGQRSAPFSRMFPFVITDVIHSTHTEEKNGICSTPGKASFNAGPKRKSRACHETFKLNYEDGAWVGKEVKGRKVNLLPGIYVWFSMKPTLPVDKKFNKAHYPVSYVDGTSFYGPWSFTFGYSELIEAYEKQIPAGAHVVLKNGGTLMYKNEVCYVVIITHSHDTIHDDETYPILHTRFTTDGVLSLGGDYSCPPTFHPRCVPYPFPIIPQWNGYDKDKLKHYDHVAFAVHCDWDRNHFEIDLPDDQPKCFFGDHNCDEESYRNFHPRCLSRGVEKRELRKRDGSLYSRFYPRCYDNELLLNPDGGSDSDGDGGNGPDVDSDADVAALPMEKLKM